MIICYLLTALVWIGKPAAALVPRQNSNTSYPNGSCKTVNDKDCVFPFSDGDVLYEQCAPQNGKFWCAVLVKADNVYQDWDYCDPNTCSLLEDSSPKLMDNSQDYVNGRAPPNRSWNYCTEYLGGLVIKMFQSFGATELLKVPRHYIANPEIEYWNRIPDTYGVYLFFMGKDVQGVEVNWQWNDIRNTPFLTRNKFKNKNIIPWYVGKHKHIKTRFGEHNRQGKGAITKWRKMLGYEINPDLTNNDQPIHFDDINGFSDLYFTYIPLDNEFDNVFIETIFLHFFNFPNNYADNYDYRNNFENPPMFDEVDNVLISDVDYYPFTRSFLNERVLFNVNRFFPFLFNEMMVNNPEPVYIYTQNTLVYPVLPDGQNSKREFV